MSTYSNCVFPAAVGPMTAVFVPPLTEKETFLRACLSPKASETLLIAEVAAESRPERAGFLGLRRHQNRAQAHVGSAGLRHHVAHESQQDDGKDEQREITVERREISQGHAAEDHEAAAEQKNDDGGQIDGQGDGRDHGGHDAEDGEADIPGLGVRGSEFFSLEALRIEDADERGSEDALIDDAVQPVDGFLTALEQNSDLPEREEKGAARPRAPRPGRSAPTAS